MTKRCPWCGEIISRPGFSSMGEYRCRCCGKKSAVKVSSLSYWIPAAFSFLLIFITRSPYAAISLLTIVASSYLNSLLAPLERLPRKWTAVKTAEAELSLSKDMNYFKKRITFLEDKIFMICFINDDGTPISRSVAVAADHISFGENNIDLRISFMPYNDLNTDFCKGTAFCLFENDKPLCSGVLTCGIAYPRFDISVLPDQ